MGAGDEKGKEDWNLNVNGIAKGPQVRMGALRGNRYNLRIESHYNDLDASKDALGFDI
jgi:hypothetical protein